MSRQSASRLPKWLRRPIPPAGSEGVAVQDILDGLSLNTVCRSARCPNRSECFARGTATFLILGSICTRNCRFCAIEPAHPLPPRADEPAAVAEAAAKMGLRYVVITSVTRDDLPDGGAEYFAATVEAIRRNLPTARVEVLVGDLGGGLDAMDRLLAARPDVVGHNIETVPRLYPLVRPQFSFETSLRVLRHLSESRTDGSGHPMLVKSSLMIGLGETRREVTEAFQQLRLAGCQILTIGQYLQPTSRHYPVQRYVPPAEFEELRQEASDMGFLAVAAGPLVRSSYHAGALASGC